VLAVRPPGVVAAKQQRPLAGRDDPLGLLLGFALEELAQTAPPVVLLLALEGFFVGSHGAGAGLGQGTPSKIVRLSGRRTSWLAKLFAVRSGGLAASRHPPSVQPVAGPSPPPGVHQRAGRT